MKVITSQSYIDPEIVEAKKAQLAGAESVDLIVWTTNLTDLDGEEVCILSDGHHTYAAACELGIEVNFCETEHPEGIDGETLLDAAWMDGEYHYLGSNVTVW